MTSSPDGTPLILITRPAEDAAGLLSALEAKGYRGLVEPMLSIRPVPGAAVDLRGCQAVLFTSANGVRAFAGLSDRRDLAAIAVGPASAREARAIGFGTVRVAGGDVSALAETVRETLKPENGALYHAAGSVTAGDLAGLLEADGFTLRRVPLYAAEPADRLSDDCRAALDENRLAAATFFSPRTAGVFVRLLEKEGRASRARTVSAVCLSTAVAEKLSGADQDVVWADIRVARAPETDELVVALDGVVEQGVDTDDDRTRAMADDRKTPEGEQEELRDGETPAEETATAEPEDGSVNDVADGDTMPPLDADAVIEAFGGIRPMASKLGVAVSTVQGWKTRNHIPDNRWRDIIAAAGAHGVDLGAALPDADATDVADSETSETGEETTEHMAAETESESPWGGGSETTDESSGETALEAEPEPAREEHTSAEHAPEETPRETREEPRRESSRETSGEAPREAPAKAGGGGKTAMLVAAVALAAVVARPVWGPHVDPLLASVLPVTSQPGGITVTPEMVGISQEIAALKATLEAFAEPAEGGGAPPELVSRLATVEGQLAALETELAGIRDIGASLRVIEAESKAALDETRSALQAAVEREEGTRARLVERLGVVESLLAQVTGEAERTASGLAGLEALVAGQGETLAALESRPAVEGAAMAGLALAVGDVEAALTDGRPFAGALDRLAGLAAGETAVLDAVGALRPNASAGVPTKASLMTDFGRTAPTMQAELNAKGGDWLDTLVDGATSLVSIRKKGETPDLPPVSRAEAALDRGDLISAVAALAPVRDGSEAVAAWLDGAEARIAAEADLATLRAAASAALNPGMSDDGDAS